MCVVESALSIDDIMLSGPIKDDKDLSVPRMRNDPTSEPIFMRLLKEDVKVEVTEDHPSLLPSCSGVTDRGVVLPDKDPEAPNTGVLGTVLDTDRVGRKALGGAALTESDVRRFIDGGNRGVLYPLSDSDRLGLRALTVKTGS